MNNNYIGYSAYNKFTQFPKLSYNCIAHLINNNELVWKLLKYPDSEAWSYDNLTLEEKASLIFSGQSDASKFHVFMDSRPPDVFVNETTILRITPLFAIGENRTIGQIEMSMDVYSHYKINHLSNYQTRVDTIIGELLSIFNGADIGGVGLLNFNQILDERIKVTTTSEMPYVGKQIIFSTNVA